LFNYPFFLLAIVLAVFRFTESDYHFGIIQPFLQIYKVSNYSTVNVNIYNTIIVVGDRNTGTHHAESRIVGSSTEELELSNVTHAIVDSSTEELEQSNAAHATVDSSTEELEQSNAAHAIVDSSTEELEYFA
jgi:hypothetical protein